MNVRVNRANKNVKTHLARTNATVSQDIKRLSEIQKTHVVQVSGLFQKLK